MTDVEGLCVSSPVDRSGTYAIGIKDGAIHFRLIKDHCPRRLTIDGQTWSRVDRSRPPTAAPAALDNLKLLAGTWHCMTKDPGDPHDVGLPSTLRIEPEYNGWSFVVRDDFANASGLHASWSFDNERQDIIVLGRQQLGAWFQLTARGWQGDHVTFA